MVDLHMHTIYSDGDKTVAEILEMCEKQKLEYISITDHNTCKQYEDKAIEKNNIYSGKIIKGVELNAIFQKQNIEILAYNIDTKIISEWIEIYYSEEKTKEQNKICEERLLNICDKQGLIYDKNTIEIIRKKNYMVIRNIYKELMKYEQNYDILGELTESFSKFFRKGLANPESVFFLGFDEFRPKYKEVINIIHKANGKAFLAHPFEYGFENTIGFIDNLMQESKLDGIECFHPSAMIDESKKDILIEYARNYNLYISGGSDYHGIRKPDIKLGIGRGNLNISKEIIEEWI